ncbi:MULTISPECIES: GNAT family N-acetyltransferase [unclassified Rathayibacter]|uniref:GNAT family N-acetyltransferase n=1 Tax=unclassified Rathayibacter TaxID=2609250 RepID=UPI00188A5ED6|nr:MULTISPECIES: GNAT family N-acetyltransferase [unclassified Rathayibacter]MBF4460980.1 GNAT family N-acetyltransferase [Rathayibacter sp. VKM Ac-2879]MBF4502391.1 GNAT family N-acetyltransferase [Rathayibacter sp. VKM Ac-2878]
MTGPEPRSDHRAVSIDQQSESPRLVPWPQVELAALRSAAVERGLKTEGDLLALHERYLRAWSDETAFFYAIELDGHCVGIIGYWYGQSRGVIAYEAAWSIAPEAHGIATRSVRLLLEQAAEYPMPRFVHAYVPADDADVNATCFAAGFDRVDVIEQGDPVGVYADWAFDLAAVA